jgi:hypothetical protein
MEANGGKGNGPHHPCGRGEGPLRSVIEFASTQFKLKPEDAAKIWAYFKNSVIKDEVASDEAIRIELRRAGKGEAKPSAVSDFSIVKALEKEMGP